MAYWKKWMDAVQSLEIGDRISSQIVSDVDFRADFIWISVSDSSSGVGRSENRDYAVLEEMFLPFSFFFLFFYVWETRNSIHPSIFPSSAGRLVCGIEPNRIVLDQISQFQRLTNFVFQWKGIRVSSWTYISDNPRHIIKPTETKTFLHLRP